MVRPNFTLVWPLTITEHFKMPLPEWKEISPELTPEQSNYFYDHILTALKPATRLRREITSLTVQIDNGPFIALALTATLHLYPDRTIAILIIEAEPKVGLDLDQYAEVVYRLRRAFTTWPEALFRSVQFDNGEAITPVCAGESKIPRLHVYWQYLLAGRSDGEALPFANPYYEQIPCFLFLPLSQPWQLSDDDFVSLAQGGPPSRHPRGFREDVLARNVYARWWDPPLFTTRYYVGEHSCLALTEQAPFAQLLRGYVADLYVPILMLTHMGLCGLRIHSDRIMALANDKDASTDQVCRAYSQFLAKSIFQEVSGQEQALDLYDRMCREVRLRQLQEDLSHRAEILVELEENASSKRIANSNIQQTVVTFIGVILASLFGYWGMNLVGGELCCALMPLPTILGLLGSLALFAVLFFFAINIWEPLARFLNIGGDSKRNQKKWGRS